MIQLLIKGSQRLQNYKLGFLCHVVGTSCLTHINVNREAMQVHTVNKNPIFCTTSLVRIRIRYYKS